MEIKNNGILINVISKSNSIPNNKIPILFLHGFTGSANDWRFLFPTLNSKYFPIAIDLPGHGETIVPNKIDNFSTSAYINIIDTVLNHFKISKVIIVGYSMGGRAALSFAIENPNKIISLILESSTAGIENEREQQLRKKSDIKLAKKLLQVGIEHFINDWMDLPFFQSLKSLDNSEYKKIILNKKNNSPQKLANSLIGFSTGAMPCLWKKLNLLTFPVLLISGSNDTKYVRLNKKINKLILNSQLEIIEDCGHNTHLEKQQVFIILINKFLNNLDNKNEA